MIGGERAVTNGSQLPRADPTVEDIKVPEDSGGRPVALSLRMLFNSSTCVSAQMTPSGRCRNMTDEPIDDYSPDSSAPRVKAHELFGCRGRWITTRPGFGGPLPPCGALCRPRSLSGISRSTCVLMLCPRRSRDHRGRPAGCLESVVSGSVVTVVAQCERDKLVRVEHHANHCGRRVRGRSAESSRTITSSRSSPSTIRMTGSVQRVGSLRAKSGIGPFAPTQHVTRARIAATTCLRRLAD